MNKTPLFLAALGLMLLSFANNGASHPLFYRTANGQEISFPELITDLRDQRTVFLGEIHDRPDHHQAQLQVIRSLHQTGCRLVIGLEMFQHQDQEALDDLIAGRLPIQQVEALFKQNWSSWALYQPIIEFAREHRIKLLALNIPREVVRQVAMHGFQSLSAEQLRELGPITCNVDPVYRAFIRRSLGFHAHLGKESFEHFCEAQLVWDTAMAQHVEEHLQKHPAATVVVLAGRGHAWKYGIPSRLSLPADTCKVVLPGEGGPAELVNTRDADYLWLPEAPAAGSPPERSR